MALPSIRLETDSDEHPRLSRAVGSYSISIAPSADELAKVAATDLTNPFLSPLYAQVRASTGELPIVISFDHYFTEHSALAFLRLGRARRSLDIPTCPSVGANRSFWQAIREIRDCLRLTDIHIDSFGSVGSAVPPLALRARTSTRTEYLIDVGPSELRSRVTNGHRRNMNKAIRAGLTVHERNERSACEIHARMIASSFSRRRERGEKLEADPTAQSFYAFIDSGLGRIVQLEHNGTVVCSSLYLTADEGAYYHTTGTTDRGKDVGASPYLVSVIVDSFRGSSRRVLNLGGTRPDEHGLAQYKREFRSTMRPLVSYSLSSRGMFRRVLNACSRRSAADLSIVHG